MNVTNPHILIVDDDKRYARQLEEHLRDLGVIQTAFSEEEFKKAFSPYKHDLILLDLRLREGKEGLDLLSQIVEEDPAISVIIISGFGDIATAVEALHNGAKTFIEKHRVSFEEIRLRVEHILKESVSQRRIQQLEASLEQGAIIGQDSKIQSILKLIEGVASDGDMTVLVRGETGTGKELVARAIHSTGVRKQGPFVSVSLADVNSETITSELFGHEKGAFTGAQNKHHGFFERAHRGILFMDEIGELPDDVQSKLLRVLDQRKFRRMGGVRDISVDIQLVTATNRSLEEMVKDGLFRQDLYYRLKVFEIHLPPLRERGEDISLLANHFLHDLRLKGRTLAEAFSDDAMQLMLGYRWPGNVRELRSSVESAALRCKLERSKKITRKHLMPLLLNDPVGFAGQFEIEGSIDKKLAAVELDIVEDALIRTGGKKGDAWKLAGYSNRFAMLKRVKRHLNEYPDLVEKFPEVRKNYV